MTQQLETAIVVYLYIDEDCVDGSYISHRPNRGSTHLAFNNFTSSLKLSYMAQIGNAVFPAGLLQPQEVIDAVPAARLPQPREVVDAVVPAARLPQPPEVIDTVVPVARLPKIIDLVTPKAPRTNVHDPLVSSSGFAYVRSSIGFDASGKGMNIKIEGSMNKRKRSNNTQQCNSPPRKI
jgi:hypothetical protein